MLYNLPQECLRCNAVEVGELFCISSHSMGRILIKSNESYCRKVVD